MQNLIKEEYRYKINPLESTLTILLFDKTISIRKANIHNQSKSLKH